MAIRITRIDDIDGSEGAEAVAFEFDHKAYEIDLCVRNRLRFFRVIEPFIERARFVGPNGQESTITTIVSRTLQDSLDVAEPSSGHRPAIDDGLGDSNLSDMTRRMKG
jgi:hypothetical protein